jgi:hypothetical protein
MNKLKRALVGLLSLVVTLAGALLLWGLLEPYFLDEERQVAIIPDLPPAWEEQRFALLADWQVGMWWPNIATIRQAINRITQERPAFVLIAGDFIYHTATGDTEEVKKAARLIRPLTAAGIPVYAVLGNHDYGMQTPDGTPDEQLARRMTVALEDSGVRVLNNEAVALRMPSISSGPGDPSLVPTKTLYLVGVGPSWPKRADVDAALAKVPRGAPRLVMMHNPSAFAHLPPGAAPVAVAGHTHGGQIRLPSTPRWTWMNYFKSDAVYADGWALSSYGHDENRLYVNRGIGFSLLPLRLNAVPELTYFTLRSR